MMRRINMKQITLEKIQFIIAIIGLVSFLAYYTIFFATII